MRSPTTTGELIDPWEAVPIYNRVAADGTSSNLQSDPRLLRAYRQAAQLGLLLTQILTGHSRLCTSSSSGGRAGAGRTGLSSQ